MRFSDLNEAQILAIAITAEEEDGRIYRDFAQEFRKNFPATTELFERMSDQESGHRHRLIELYRKKFGEHIPLIRRNDVKDFWVPPSSMLLSSLRPEKAREQAALMEVGARRFYEAAVLKCKDAAIRQLLGDLAQEEQRHEKVAEQINEKQAADGELDIEEHVARQQFVLRIVQPGLAGLMDGSVSTLAPLFAAAFATGNTADAFKVGLAASVGAGISMGFAEALSDDGKISGRGTPWIRGGVCGIMTAVGGLGHTLPFLFRDFHLAMTVAMAVVVVELNIIALIRWRYMDTPFLSAGFQVIAGGFLVFLAGWIIGAG
ncbi:MAG: rubrerythrin [Candidatus Omnitrophica bacterium]|nr:rubrerythrin [Candidatus Omnitrophota bacterium]MDE2009305.1 rubrerythrin [Candidatus Omnitrophota bacterium]MDE2215405.1 rubrerythrin [Candidatus Omnitrophota bacterium]MDE2232280.1 rubrerythrin [Candidatus Omnitrophota bacterium]